MIEFVFKPSRIVDGKRVRSDCYSGRYAVSKGARPITVPLNTPDKEIARKRLRDIMLEKQREHEGMIPSRSVRDAAAAPLVRLVEDYERELSGLGRVKRHVHDTVTRLRRIFSELKWRQLSDVRADKFAQWRSGLQLSAKTMKEYQISLNAFLNWLVKSDRLAANPIARVGQVETRGKQVRACRAYTEDEISHLFAVAGKYLLAYQVLLYTGQRKSQVRSLVWGDLHLEEAQPYALFREGTTKNKNKHAVPLRSELAGALRAARPADVDPTKKVFWFNWPTYDILRGDLKRAGIAHRDAMGRVVHIHAFRHTWQTFGVRYGVNQRAAQEVMDHSDPSLTANVYTDVPALSLHAEMAKLPWITRETGKTPNSQNNAQESGVRGPVVSLADVYRQLGLCLQATGTEGKSPSLASPVTPCQTFEMAARAGIEPATK